MKDGDIKHLEWVYERMNNVHNENENYDYMIRFREILEALRQSDIKESLNEVLSDLSKLSTSLYMNEDIYNGKDGENFKYREKIYEICEKINIVLNSM